MNGKILQNEIINKVNHDNQIVSFCYILKVEDRDVQEAHMFKFNRISERVWCIELVIGYQVYKIQYEVPKVNMDLTMVAAMGLRNLQYEIAQELEKKSILNFTIGDEIRDM